MSIKQGFGSLTDELISVYTLGLPTNSNRCAVIQLPSKNEKRILDIHVSHTAMAGFPLSGLFGSRLLVVGGKFDSFQDEIFPDRKELPDSLNTFNVYFDIFVGANVVNNTASALIGGDCQTITRSFSFPNGILIPEGTDCSVILTYAMETYQAGKADKYATTEKQLATLNVNGLITGSDKIYKEL